MKPRQLGALCVVLVGLASSSPGLARDMDDGWLLSPSRARSCALGSTPGADRSWVACGTGRLFGMAELPLQSLAVHTTRSALSLDLAWQTLGAEAWREHRYGAVLGMGRRAGIDVAWSMRRCETVFADPWLRQEVTVILRFGREDVWSVAIHGDPQSLSPGRAASSHSRWLVVQGSREGLAWAVHVDRRDDASPAARVAVLGRLVRGAAFGVLGEGGTGCLGLTSVWVRGGMSLRTSHLVHPALGVSHRWMLVLGGAAS